MKDFDEAVARFGRVMTLSLTGLVLAVILTVIDIDQQLANYRSEQEKEFISSLKLAAQLSDGKIAGAACTKSQRWYDRVNQKDLSLLTSCSIATLQDVHNQFTPLLPFDVQQLEFPLCLNAVRIKEFSDHCGGIAAAKAVRTKLKDQIYSINVLGAALSIPAKWAVLLILFWFMASGLYFLFRRLALLETFRSLAADAKTQPRSPASYPLWLGEAWLLRPRPPIELGASAFLHSPERERLLRMGAFLLLVLAALLVATYTFWVASAATDDRTLQFAKSTGPGKNDILAVSEDVRELVRGIAREKLSAKVLDIEPASDLLFKGAGSLSFLDATLVWYASVALWLVGVAFWSFGAALHIPLATSNDVVKRGKDEAEPATTRPNQVRRDVVVAFGATLAACILAVATQFRGDGLSIKRGAAANRPPGSRLDRSAKFKSNHLPVSLPDGIYQSVGIDGKVRGYIVEEGWVLFAGDKFKGKLSPMADFSRLDLAKLPPDFQFNAKIREYALERAVLENIRLKATADLTAARQDAIKYLNNLPDVTSANRRGFASRLVALRDRLNEIENWSKMKPPIPKNEELRRKQRGLWVQPIYSKPKTSEADRPKRLIRLRQIDLATGLYRYRELTSPAPSATQSSKA